MNIANVLVGAVRFDFNAVDSISIISGSAYALVSVAVLVKLAVSERVTVVDDITRD